MTSDTRYRDQDLWIPASFHKEFVDNNRLVDRGDPRAPFGRQIDLWWYALGIGVAAGERSPLPGRDQLVRFNEGGILESDPWRITHLELLVLGEQGDEATSNPSSVLQIANEYAVTGFRILAEQLRGVIDPQTHLMGEIVRQAER